MNKEDKAFLRSVGYQLLALVILSKDKPERWRACALSLRQAADRLDERAAEAEAVDPLGV